MAVLKKNMWFILLCIGGVLLSLTVRDLRSRIVTILSDFIPSVEGFRSTPYWDVSRYSWGYGTRAPGATGSITRDRAFAEMLAYLMDDYDYLLGYITRSLTANQWAALLSFSYNLGNDDARDIAPLINSGDDEALEREWMRYVHSGGVVNDDLVTRRRKEIELWKS